MTTWWNLQICGPRVSLHGFETEVLTLKRDRVRVRTEDGTFAAVRDASGRWGDIWVYGDAQSPVQIGAVAVGFERPDFTPITMDEVHPWRQVDRLADMDGDHIEASLCFPNIVARFCGQTFLEGPDKEMGLECVRAYNDWMLDDWTAGAGKGRLIPLTLIPLWDVQFGGAGGEEMRWEGRCCYCLLGESISAGITVNSLRLLGSTLFSVRRRAANDLHAYRLEFARSEDISGCAAHDQHVYSLSGHDGFDAGLHPVRQSGAISGSPSVLRRKSGGLVAVRSRAGGHPVASAPGFEHGV